jgi:D-3-phosphoglycerate dehydrogenase
MQMDQIIAIVPMRHYSQRVPEKNYRKLGDIPLYCHIIDTLSKCSEISLIVIETDSKIIKDGVKDRYQNSNSRIILLDRPEKIIGVDVSMNQILINAIHRLKIIGLIKEDPIIFQTHVTNPFLSLTTVKDAIQKYRDLPSDLPEVTMMSVTKYQKRLWTKESEPINHRLNDLVQTQDLEPIYEENSNFYLFRVSTLLKFNNRIGTNKQFYPMNVLEAWDIDTEDDFQIAQVIHKKMLSNSDQSSQQQQNQRNEQNQDVNPELLSELLRVLKPEITQYQQGPSSESKPTVLISAPYMMPEIKTFAKFYETIGINTVIADVEERLSKEDMKKYHGQYQVSVCGDDAFTEEIIRDSGVRAICKWGTGIDSIDTTYCQKENIPVLNTPNAFSVPVSQSIIAAILGFARTTFHSNQEMKNTNNWVKYQGYTLEELTIGIVGLGNIGRHVAEGITGFRPRILGYDINPNLPAIPWVTNTPDLQTLLRESDIVCLCTTLNPTSHHLINHQTILQMKGGAYLINMARGPLVQERALVKAIQERHLAGAALDVFEVEPLLENSPLRTLPNVIISSHNTNSSPKYWMKVHVNTLRNSLKALQMMRRTRQ